MSSPWRLREKEREHWKKKLPRNSHRRVACRPRRPGRKRPRCLPGRLAGRSRVRGRRVGPRRAAPGRLVSAAGRRPSAIDRTAAGERQHGRDRAGPGLVLLVRLVLAVSVGCSPAAAGEQGQQEQQEHEGERRRRRSSASPPVEREHGCSLALSACLSLRYSPEGVLVRLPLVRVAWSGGSRVAPCFQKRAGRDMGERRRRVRAS